MNKTVRAWEVAVSLGRARRTISFYFPYSRPSRVPANHWKSERALVFMDGTALIVYTGGRNSRLKDEGGKYIGNKNTTYIESPLQPLSRECGTREAVRDERWSKTKGWTKSSRRPLRARTLNSWSNRVSGKARLRARVPGLQVRSDALLHTAPFLFYESCEK